MNMQKKQEQGYAIRMSQELDIYPCSLCLKTIIVQSVKQREDRGNETSLVLSTSKACLVLRQHTTPCHRATRKMTRSCDRLSQLTLNLSKVCFAANPTSSCFLSAWALMLHHFPEESRWRLNRLLSTIWDIPRLCLLPAESTPSAGTLWVEAGTASLTPCTWPSSSWLVRNAEHRSDSRAWSFRKEFCQQKQNMKPAERMPSTQHRVCSSSAPLSGCGDGRKRVWASRQLELVPESDAHWSTCSLDFWLIEILTYTVYL